jgi:hypothetical protein
MFENQQAAADALKGVILDLTTVNRDVRIAGLRAIHNLERCGWNRYAFAEAMESAGVSLDENGFSFADEAITSIGRLIAKYLELMSCGEGEADPFADIFTIEGAAEFLGISIDMMKTYAYRQHRIRGKVFGKTTLFTRQQLEKFKQEMRPSGNPNFKAGEE